MSSQGRLLDREVEFGCDSRSSIRTCSKRIDVIMGKPLKCSTRHEIPDTIELLKNSPRAQCVQFQIEQNDALNFRSAAECTRYDLLNTSLQLCILTSALTSCKTASDQRSRTSALTTKIKMRNTKKIRRQTSHSVTMYINATKGNKSTEIFIKCLQTK